MIIILPEILKTNCTFSCKILCRQWHSKRCNKQSKMESSIPSLLKINSVSLSTADEIYKWIAIVSYLTLRGRVVKYWVSVGWVDRWCQSFPFILVWKQFPAEADHQHKLLKKILQNFHVLDDASSFMCFEWRVSNDFGYLMATYPWSIMKQL